MLDQGRELECPDEGEEGEGEGEQKGGGEVQQIEGIVHSHVNIK